MFKEFGSKEAMVAYEHEREQYYCKWIDLCDHNILGMYKLWFLETFHPKYRAVKKEYDGYSGGWYRNERGYACAECIHFIDSSKLKDEDICIEYLDDDTFRVYVFKDDKFCMIDYKSAISSNIHNKYSLVEVL